ncbi:MAG: sigma 54-interacting transcriptional regulator [Thermodesulfobacteriota bacterium]
MPEESKAAFPSRPKSGRRRRQEPGLAVSPVTPPPPNTIILDSIADGVFTVDLEQRITFFNRAAQEITGVPKDAALGRPCSEVFRASSCGTACALRHTLQTGQPVANRPMEILRADGQQILIGVSTAPLKDGQGQIIGGVETFRDLRPAPELRGQAFNQNRLGGLISKSPLITKIFERLPAMARADSTVLIQGESGTGKEVVARALHILSPRSQGPFVVANCGALPDAVLVSELFGHTAGAFPDARRERRGHFAMAAGGTLFLNEIGEISPALQVRLLRVLEEHAYTPLGASQGFKADVRLVTSASSDLERLVKAGAFRKDLYYRLSVIKLRMPNLAERREDLPFLAQHFIASFNKRQNKRIEGLSGDALAIFLGHDWPGNLRELENAIEHAFIVCSQGLILPQHLPDHFHPQNRTVSSRGRGLSLKEQEKRLLREALERHQWRRLATARELGIDKNTLRRKIERFGLKPPDQGDSAS